MAALAFYAALAFVYFLLAQLYTLQVLTTRSRRAKVLRACVASLFYMLAVVTLGEAWGW